MANEFCGLFEPERPQQEIQCEPDYGIRAAGSESSPSATGRSAARSGAKYARRRSRLVPSAQELGELEFVAVDFETANRKGGVSACQVALVRIQNGRVLDRYTSYLCPPVGWDHFEFTYLHGISQRETRAAPAWHQISEDILQFSAGMPVYAHNAAFDARVWRELDEFFGTNTLPNRFFCSYRLAQRVVPGLPNYKLPTVVDHCLPGYHLKHHRADADAEACGLIVASLQAQGAAHLLP